MNIAYGGDVPCPAYGGCRERGESPMFWPHGRALGTAPVAGGWVLALAQTLPLPPAPTEVGFYVLAMPMSPPCLEGGLLL